jgi:hypothetical protein
VKLQAGDYVGLTGAAAAIAGSLGLWGWQVTALGLGAFLVALWLFIELRPRKGRE